MKPKYIHPKEYTELRSIYKYYIDTYNVLYQLKTENEEELNSIYKIIKTELIDSRNYSPTSIVKDVFSIIIFNNRYTNSYLTLAKFITDDYHLTQIDDNYFLPYILFYKKYGIKLINHIDCKNDFTNIDIHRENTICNAIMYNDLERFIFFTEREGFDKDQKISSHLYPYGYNCYSLLELCCYHGAVDCFKLLRSKFQLEITEICLEFSFLGGNAEIMSECLKYQTPNKECMEYAIISHNIDFVTFLMNEYNIEINLFYCETFKNLEAFLVYLDQTKDVNKCLFYSSIFNIQSFFEYLLSLGANINEQYDLGRTALHMATLNNRKEMVEILISKGANINEQTNYGETTLHFAAENNYKEIVEFLISHGAKINEKDINGATALHKAAGNNCKGIVEFLISHGAKINEKDHNGMSILYYAARGQSKETAELLISHGANINEKDNHGFTALHNAALNNGNEIAELLITHGANINEIDNDRKTALCIAAEYNNKETAEVLISHGANINEIGIRGKIALHYAERNNYEEITQNRCNCRLF
ncbi:hypothetical protein TVAG_230190 [Trichomonas vaginalis G3]|uniref:DUF3447 domain-containing protein n=1 Tax=Trichomonas vaginalis (strain ATCC PRA-98 / G3) TaxID=412133 RepID=A2F107_TRIV3|nr:ankyrin repeat and SOCS box-containing protein 4 family [Trichomonas vaginalis G3]EAY01415.1 hypothetical protein TVAG_230190 [Trichomonas vaginalis G3]KAI5529515.1 ankyrin repeat and SOCS box-containing protein 4 family [Trichomonas vaginalis G3]|eukprot:XP_001330250.1 hypothetical protein [Trichomonas vaginalis G3]